MQEINMIDSIKEKINNLLKDFERYPDKYLTESDVQCDLVSKLKDIDGLNQLYNTKDQSKSAPIHTEIRWYGQSGKLKFRSDIVILDINTLRVKEKFFRLPSKGYIFNEPKAIIEIKFRRINGESDNKFIQKINEDIDRMKKIREEVHGNYHCCLIILDKKADISQNIPRNDNNIDIYYSCKKNNGNL